MKMILIGIATALAFSSCNTTIGLGRDMRVLGTEMEKKAENTQGGGSADVSGAPVY
jgi:predicted small secreted protein